jgi:hypothetical protein
MNRLAAVFIALALGLLVSSAAFALDCEPSLTTSIRTLETQVDALLVDYADLPVAQRDDDNIAEMRGELALIRDACSRGREVEAVWRFEAVQRRIIAARKSIARRASWEVPHENGLPYSRQARRPRQGMPQQRANNQRYANRCGQQPICDRRKVSPKRQTLSVVHVEGS